MEEYTNSHKLAAVLSQWARPAVTKIASDRLTSLSWVKSLQDGIVNLGIVRNNYNIALDIEPLLMPAVDSMIEPLLRAQLSKLPDDSIPMMARSIVGQLEKSNCVSLLDGLVVLEKSDIQELKRLIDLNLPMSECKTYKVITDEQQ